MKRIGLLAVGIGVLATAGLVSVEQAFAGDGAPKCSVATLKGRYLFSAPGIIFPEAAVASAASIP